MMMTPSRIAAPITGAVLALTSTLAVAQVATFRIDDMQLRDPHVYVNVIGCNDVTDPSPLGFSFNGLLYDAITGDSEPDGFLDLSTLIEFLPLNQAQTLNLMDSGPAQCTAPLAGTTCGPIISSQLAGDASLSSSTTCLSPLAGTTSGYLPAVISATAPCFSSPAGPLTLSMAGILITLQNAQIAATFDGIPASGMSNGLLRGFLPESTADSIILPGTIPIIGNQPLSRFLAGGTNSCATGDDRDTYNTESGWWFYFNYTATGPTVVDTAVFADGFEN